MKKMEVAHHPRNLRDQETNYVVPSHILSFHEHFERKQSHF